MSLPSTQITNPLAKGFAFEGSRETGVLLIHGFTDTPASMRPLGEALREKGYTVRGIQLPGHGTSLADMAKTHWQDWLRATRTACMDLIARCQRVFVCGLSMGGVLSLMMAEEFPIEGAIPISAPMEVHSKLMRWAWLFQGVYPYTPWKKSGEPVGEPDAYLLGYDGAPTCKVPDLLHLMDDARHNLDRIQCPLLIIQSRADETVKPVSAEIISQGAVHAVPRNILYLENAPHNCTTGASFPLIVSRVLDFVEQPQRG